MSTSPPKASVRPYVLSKQEIDALPMENYSDNPKRVPGGWQQIFCSPNTPTNELNIGLAKFPPASKDQTQISFEPLHRHKQAEFYYILSGSAIVKIDDVDYDVSPGHALFIPGDAEHGFSNTDTENELVFLWGFAADGFRDIIFRFTGDSGEWRAE